MIRVATSMPSSSTPADKSRRALFFAAIAVAAGAGLALYATSRQWWVKETARTAPLPPHIEKVTGRDETPWASAVAFVALAGAAALLATRRVGRVLVAVLVVVSGAALVTAGVLGLDAPDQVRDVRTSWPVLLLVGGVLVAGAGVLVLWRQFRGASSGGLGARFDASPERASDDKAADHDTTPDDAARWWDALDEGRDPTRSRDEHAG